MNSASSTEFNRNSRGGQRIEKPLIIYLFLSLMAGGQALKFCLPALL
jgi:hypothetical protein